MTTRCLLIPTAPAIDARPRYDAALGLGTKLKAHLNVVFVSPDPRRFLATLPEVTIAAGATLESLEEEISAAARSSREELDRWCRDRDIVLSESQEPLDATFATWRHVVGELETEVALAGRVNDFIIIDKPDLCVRFTDRVFDAAVFSAGRPAVMVPGTRSTNMLEHVAIAWNGSLEAARAVGQAISLLHEAERVTVIEVETQRTNETRSADLATYLQYHGIVASSRKAERTSGRSVGEAILSSAERLGASLLVMGAYSHSRLRELFLGGVTQHMVKQSQIPVLMAH